MEKQENEVEAMKEKAKALGISIEEISAQMQKRMREEQEKKAKNFHQLNQIAKKGGILFTGSSLMEQFPICEMCVSAGIDKVVYNRGIGGFTTDDFLAFIHEQLLDLEPSVVFINIGTNDMNPQYGEHWQEHLLTNYRKILTIAKEKLPDTKFYLMAYYPVNDQLPDQEFYVKAMFMVRTNANVRDTNERVKNMAAELGCTYIDVNDGLTDENGRLRAAWTIEGIHMYADAYKRIFENLKPYLA